jgi:hypothetical protein
VRSNGTEVLVLRLQIERHCDHWERRSIGEFLISNDASTDDTVGVTQACPLRGPNLFPPLPE